MPALCLNPDIDLTHAICLDLQLLPLQNTAITFLILWICEKLVENVIGRHVWVTVFLGSIMCAATCMQPRLVLMSSGATAKLTRLRVLAACGRQRCFCEPTQISFRSYCSGSWRLAHAARSVNVNIV